MRNIIYFFALMLSGSGNIFAQNVVNWRNLNERHAIQFNTGLESSYIIGLGYGYKLPVKKNILLSTEYSFPTGNQLFDDFKVRVGGQGEMVHWRNWSVTVKAYALYRRYENEFATLSNFGSEFSAAAGYAKPRWQLMGEFGFDKAITTKIKNSDVLRNFYPGITDGWYVPTGGYFFYGFQSGVSFGRTDITLRAGKMTGQDFQTQLNLPLYVKLGIGYRF